ncbi:MAG: DUF4347 domain-containing protein [Cyanobacteria bacterium P01_E01_bin.35]
MNYLALIDRHRQDPLAPRRCLPNLAFIDSRVDLNQVTLMNVNRRTEIFLIDSDRDGIEQITEVLGDRCHVQSIQLIGFENGNDASLQLGLSQLNIYTLEAYLNDLSQWRTALSARSVIVLYGCLVLVESIFYNFLQQLAGITGSDIGAFVSTTDSHLAQNVSNYDANSLMMAWQPQI